jgi:pyruvate ferredoxin oxidoreductase gamma subunit
MKKELTEIKFIGRGGQGGKTAAQLAAYAAFDEGKDVQSFPEFGPEREGAPVYAYTRISDEPIKIHSGVTDPDIVVVIDDTLVFEEDVGAGMKPKGILIINTARISKEMRQRLKGNYSIYNVDASCISQKFLGKSMPNMPMLGALCKVAPIFTMKTLEKAFKQELGQKLGKEAIEKNLMAMEAAYKEVRPA